MQLVFTRKFKSITALDPIALPDFTVLTGVNGAGKSHLLEAIENGSIQIDGVPPNQPNGARPIRRFDSNTLVPQDTGAFSAAQISQEQTSFWTEISQHREPQVNSLRDTIAQFKIPVLETLDVKTLLRLSIADLASFGMSEEAAAQLHSLIANIVTNANHHVTNMFVNNDRQNRPRLISVLSEITKLPLFALEQDDFFDAFPKQWQPIDLFQHSFARLFTAYHRHWLQNKLKATANNEGENIAFLSESEFIDKHGPAPWIVLNEILEVAELDFRINEPHKWDDRPYEPILTDIKRDIRVKFNDLSSGERILMSFALCLYHASDPNSAAEFPKVILFDEIDAPLHPSMTRSLIRTIQKTLVEKHEIKVVLTTHSPSTVALAPAASIHVMQKQGPDRLRSTSKDAALGILTSGVPTLSISYENRRQIFVESKYDVQYYNALWELSKPSLNPEISLSFIASGSGGNGNCDQVRSVVDQLVTGGNRTVVGIIDWDLKNISGGAIMVLGEKDRYSIENYLLDPLLVGILLLRERFLLPENVGLKPGTRSSDAASFSDHQLQSLATAVASSLSGQNNASSGGLIEYSYSGGAKVKVPEGLSRIQGHALEEQYKEAFPPLLRYKNEPELKLALIDKVLGDFPQFIPEAIIDVFKRVQSHQ
jgi:ABC-type branched-subunit amino acid transport system ATPase component